MPMSVGIIHVSRHQVCSVYLLSAFVPIGLLPVTYSRDKWPRTNSVIRSGGSSDVQPIFSDGCNSRS